MSCEQMSKELTKTPKYKLITLIVIGTAIFVLAIYEFYDLLEFFLFKSTATRLSTVPLRGLALTNTISLTFCNPLWLNISRAQYMGISGNALAYAKSFMNLTFLSTKELEAKSAEEALNPHGKQEFLALINKSSHPGVNVKNVREFLNAAANRQENYRLKVHRMAAQLAHAGYFYTGELYCEKLRFIPDGNEYYFQVQSAKGEMLIELAVDFAGSNNSQVNGSLSLNSFDYKTAFSRAKADLLFKNNTYSTSWYSVSVEKYISLHKCQPGNKLYVPWPGLGSIICTDYCRLWNNNCSGVDFYYGLDYKSHMHLEDRSMCNATEYGDSYNRKEYEKSTQECIGVNKCESRKFCEEWEFTLTKTAFYEQPLNAAGNFSRRSNLENVGVHAVQLDFSRPMLMYAEIQMMTPDGFARDFGYLLGLFFGFSATSISRWLSNCLGAILMRRKAENRVQQSSELV